MMYRVRRSGWRVFTTIGLLGLLLGLLLGAASLLEIEAASAMTRWTFLFGSLTVSSVFGYLRVSAIVRDAELIRLETKRARETRAGALTADNDQSTTT